MSFFTSHRNFKLESEFLPTERDTFIRKSSFFVFWLIFLAVKMPKLIQTSSNFQEKQKTNLFTPKKSFKVQIKLLPTERTTLILPSMQKNRKNPILGHFGRFWSSHMKRFPAWAAANPPSEYRNIGIYRAVKQNDPYWRYRHLVRHQCWSNK